MTDQITLKMNSARAKLQKAFEAHQPALQLGGMAATDPRLARAAVDAGVRILEPNHTAVACARGLRGTAAMGEAYAFKHEVPMTMVAEVVAAVRRVVTEDTFIVVGAPGTFDEAVPVPFGEVEAQTVTEVGADGLFLEKSDLTEIERLTGIAHAAGLLVQAGIQHQANSAPTAVVPVQSPEEAASMARCLWDMGVDIVGMRLTGIFKGLKAGTVPPKELDCLRALVATITGPTVVYAGINLANLKQLAATGVKMVGVASVVDGMVAQALVRAVREYL